MTASFGLTREFALPLLTEPQRWGRSAMDRYNARHTVGSPDECWPWTGGVDRAGYGRISVVGLNIIQVHRIAYLIYIGDLPAGWELMHNCDTPHCVNPAHMKLGTHTDNMHDMSIKKRANYGGSRRVLNPDLVRNMRARYAAGETISSIYRSLNVDWGTVRHAVQGRTWRHVSDNEVSA